ncbi:AraC family transcriptional regulator of adaptative response/methylated-DNA-[protein]-cysteine methyltransferase [Pontibacter mucosus]|uniref:methylated-DNA--[protein]-cysteine S-methyltransferase n=1 Tax=Pontibacter mucosus TaxID=1649266 RepID=A0A2T5YLV0_9BACT|nr:methylated-DNA--[protein]-cysteine S-methyltransferase [Pontibacter mucosus]PTX20271.1 AraC family transcriptional regulator of adaptative response/methylated-DNA-[protein]-cysteine methyltransferase [Pontibacter mucosus]
MNHYETVAKALAYIRQHALQQPSLDEVADYVHLSPQHFQRVFSEWAGVSPKKFLQYLSLQHAKSILAQSATLQEATFETGLSGSSRLHDLFVSIEGITPGQFKSMGEQLQLKYSFGTCQFGNYVVASTDKGVCYLHFYQHPEQALQELRQAWPKANLVEEQTSMHGQVSDFFDNSFSEGNGKIKLHLSGTPFQLKVWEALLRIPEGQLCSYASLARSINQPTASRAVGTAIGSNPIAFLIPCHRVIKSVGGIGEYRWGSERKMAMIGWEAAATKAGEQQRSQYELNFLSS